MNEDELVSIIHQKSNIAESAVDDIADQREQSLKYYRQDLFGNEQKGRSQVVTSDVRDTIEWILPQLVEMFIGNDNPASFKPRNQDDVDQAKQETNYVNYVYNQQNNGFLNTYTWIKDALLQKNGYIKAYWDDSLKETKEEYENQSFAEINALLQDEELELVFISVKGVNKKYKSLEDYNNALLNQEIVISDPNIKFNATFTRSENTAQVVIKTVRPEYLYVEAGYDSVDLQGCNFVREDSYISASDLIVDGYPEDVVDNLPSANDYIQSESQERFKDQGGLFFSSGDELGGTREIKVSDIYMNIDYDGDGIAELRFIKLAADTEVLENVEVDSIPYFAVTPNIMTHVHYGMSVADMVGDVQLIRSTLLRQSLDSLYLANNPRLAVLEGGVNLDDLLVSRPGGIVREKMQGAVRELNTTYTGAQSFPMFDLLDKMRSEKSGVSEVSQGLNPEALSDSTNLVGSLIMNAAQARIKMIARVIAEVGFKPLMLHIHSLLLKHEQNEKVFDLNGEFFFVNPSTWKKRRDMTINVGIGHADKKEKILALERIIALQEKVFAAQGGEGPLLNVKNVYNAVNDLINLTGLDSRNIYFSNPDDFTPPPPQETIAEKTLEVAQAEIVAKTNEAAAKYELELQKHMDTLKVKEQELIIQQEKIQLEREKILSNEKLNKQDNLTDLTETRMKLMNNNV